MSEEKQGLLTDHAKNVWKGIGIACLMLIIPAALPTLYLFIGVVQLVYIIPAIIFCRKNTGMVQGLLIAAGITFLVNAACFGLVMVKGF
jgi:hypothetical protein